MASEDYTIDGVNISTIFRKQRQVYGEFNLSKAKNILIEYDIDFKEVTQGLKFTLNENKYTYWSKINRIYLGNEKTDLTLNKFIKLHKDIFIKPNTYKVDKFFFGKYSGKPVQYVFDHDIEYINWLIDNFKTKNKKEEQFIENIKNIKFN